MNSTGADGDDAREELATNFAAIARELYSQKTLEATLRHIVDLAVQTIRGCTGAGVSLVVGEEIVTPVATNSSVYELEALQYASGQGPCLAAIAQCETVYAHDLAGDERWPEFGAQAEHSGIRSALCFCLFGDETLGALCLYAADRDAFDSTDRAQALIFATHAGVALAAAGDLADAEAALAIELHHLGNLQGALESRQVIGRAEGILMHREGITADDAFDLLREASQHLNTKLREVAQYVVDTGEVPHPRHDT